MMGLFELDDGLAAFRSLLVHRYLFDLALLGLVILAVALIKTWRDRRAWRNRHDPEGR